MNNCTRFLVVSAFAAGLQAASAGDITGTVTLTGTPPPEKVNNDIKNDAICGPLQTGPVTTHFFEVGAKGGLADVVVTLKGVTAKSTGESAAPAVLDQKNCMYTPQIMAVQTGQKLLVKNSDPVMHNVHIVPGPDGNKEDNKAQMQGAADLTFAFAKPEKFLKFKCEVHGWMFAWATVVDNPYFAVTDKDGSFKIANVPPGKYTVEIAHRKAGTAAKEVEVKDSVKVDFTLDAPKPQ